MANVYAVKSGNWSDTTVWNTGALPTSADDVYANTFTVTVDISATVLSISNGNGTGFTYGGTFSPSNGIILTCTGGGVVNRPIANGQNVITSSVTGTANIIANVSASGNISNAATILHSGTGTLNITGTINGAVSTTGSTYYAVWNSGNGIINITGNVTGTTTGNTSPAVYNSSTGTITITGTITCGTSGAAVSNSSSGTLTHIGTANATSGGPAISLGSASQNTYLTGPFIGTQSGLIANAALRWRWIQAIGSSYMTVPNYDATGYKNLYTADSTLSNSGQPGISSVRLGTVYGPNSEFTGTLAMPLPSQVYYGAPVDNTTGTAALNAADIWNYPVSGITTSGSIGERLKNAATINTVSQQISDAFSSK